MQERSTHERITPRQARLLAWLNDPARERVIAGERNVLPTHEAIDWRAAVWSVRDIVERSGVYQANQRRACLSDLRTLMMIGYLDPDVRWRLHPGLGRSHETTDARNPSSPPAAGCSRAFPSTPKSRTPREEGR